jgi:beta-glucosidase/6-phospho-beta-glucosidase/beta-galactosidase
MREGSEIFPTFFISGFECSTFIWKGNKRRKNLINETQHDKQALIDYQILKSLRISAAREAIPWPFVDRGGNYDFSCLDNILVAIKETKIIPVWDLCHYGYPDDLDPFSTEFVSRFSTYCEAASKYIITVLAEPYFFTPINEITFFSSCAAEWAWIAPFKTSKSDRNELRLNLCKATIAGVQAIKKVCPHARIIHADPLIQALAPATRPDLIHDANDITYHDSFVAYDILSGKECPELGGSPDILDIVGINYYPFGQFLYTEKGTLIPISHKDSHLQPFSYLIEKVWKRYNRPIIISETGGVGEDRVDWLKYIMAESLFAIERGVDLQAICLFPAIDAPDWHTDKWKHVGIVDLEREGDVLKRVVNKSYQEEIKQWQKIM